MRRVVTGDDIAQVRNPDPFAVPAWRSPVYRTPLWIVVIVHTVRLLARLVRFGFRHPVLVLAVVVGVLMWRVIGWLGLVILAVSIAAVLVVWRWRFPVSFSRFIATPARRQWRAWHYRRRWAGVMTIGRLAPVYQLSLCNPSPCTFAASPSYLPFRRRAALGSKRLTADRCEGFTCDARKPTAARNASRASHYRARGLRLPQAGAADLRFH